MAAELQLLQPLVLHCHQDLAAALGQAVVRALRLQEQEPLLLAAAGLGHAALLLLLQMRRHLYCSCQQQGTLPYCRCWLLHSC
jgi:hypothetical protein